MTKYFSLKQARLMVFQYTLGKSLKIMNGEIFINSKIIDEN